MKICMIGEQLTLLCGVGRPAFELARELATMGNEVTVISDELSLELEEMDKQLFERENFDNFEILRPSKSLARDFLLKRSKMSCVVQNIVNRADVVHGMDLLALFGLVRSYNFNMPAPIVYTSTGSLRLRIGDIINAGVSSLQNIIRPNYAVKFLCPNLMIRSLYNHFDKIIATSNFAAEAIYSIGISREKVKVIPVGMDIKRFSHIRDVQIATLWNFLYFGWASAIRGFPDVLSAFELVIKKEPTAKLCVCFPRHHLEDKLYRYGIAKSKIADSNSITEKGFEPDIIRLVQSSDSIILPFRSSFGHPEPPLTVLEGMMLGKPVISTLVGSVPEEITDGETGFLVQPRDSKALAQKMLLTYDKELCRRVGEHAHEHVIERHDIRVVARKIVEVYEDVIRGF